SDRLMQYASGVRGLDDTRTMQVVSAIPTGPYAPIFMNLARSAGAIEANLNSERLMLLSQSYSQRAAAMHMNMVYRSYPNINDIAQTRTYKKDFWYPHQNGVMGPIPASPESILYYNIDGPILNTYVSNLIHGYRASLALNYGILDLPAGKIIIDRDWIASLVF